MCDFFVLFTSSHFITTAVFTVDIGCSSMQWSWHLPWTQNTKVFLYEDLPLARTLVHTNLQVRYSVIIILACNFPVNELISYKLVKMLVLKAKM
jgi:hypothetical protein